jgi:hypothetical protein
LKGRVTWSLARIYRKVSADGAAHFDIRAVWRARYIYAGYIQLCRHCWRLYGHQTFMPPGANQRAARND